ncbi:hypothetical protein [Lysobacter sp. Root667]|uniref:hypothetical protein n=1 Tax=Lysobacter sp. Root667 TaxID=1736581 RepID=UPI000A41BF63|nr:hypothetical protein [Lysobacter sp. Root667]
MNRESGLPDQAHAHVDQGWPSAARTVQAGAMAGFVVLLLAIMLAVLGIRGVDLSLVELSKWGAVTAGLLQLRAAVLATCLVASARRRLARDRDRELRAVADAARPLRTARLLARTAWLLALSTVSLPLMMELPLHVPETGVVFGLLLMAAAVQVLAGATSYRSLAAALAGQGAGDGPYAVKL